MNKLIEKVKQGGEDYEFYPTTGEIILPPYALAKQQG